MRMSGADNDVRAVVLVVLYAVREFVGVGRARGEVLGEEFAGFGDRVDEGGGVVTGLKVRDHLVAEGLPELGAAFLVECRRRQRGRKSGTWGR